jgi:protein-S-isoprenylcysteine O-methyltransferase Ste14
MNMVYGYLIAIPWIAFVVYWRLSALNTKRTVSHESFGSRALVLILQITGYVLIFGKDLARGFLSKQILNPTAGLAAAAVILTWAGIGIAVWARRHLGQYWSSRVTLKEDHQLIRTGPYAYFRHPIYSGLDLATIGGLLAVDRWRCVLGAALVILAYAIKAKKEESMLTEQFGDEFRGHCQQTGFLFPKF